jgi:hypothetical protein
MEEAARIKLARAVGAPKSPLWVVAERSVASRILGMKQVKSAQQDLKKSGGKPYSPEDLRQIHIATGISVVAGIWLLIAPVLFNEPQPVIRLNDSIAGVILFVLALVRYVHPLHLFWTSWLTALVGLWLTGSPFLLGCHYIVAQVNDTTLGFIAFVAGAVSASVRSGGR